MSSFWITNDTQKRVEGRIILKLQTLSGKTLFQDQFDATAPSNSSVQLITKNLDKLPLKDSRKEFLSVEFMERDKILSENALFFERYKHLDLKKTKPEIQVKQVSARDTTFEVNVSSRRFAKAAYLELPDVDASFDDNYFDLVPGRRKTVLIRTRQPITLRKLRSALVSGSVDSTR